MQITNPKHQKYIFVCENSRVGSDCCMPQGEQIREILKIKIKDLGMSQKIRVSRSGCLDMCADGPNVLLMPDNVWFKKVSEKDIEAILAYSVERLADRKET